MFDCHLLRPFTCDAVGVLDARDPSFEEKGSEPDLARPELDY